MDTTERAQGVASLARSIAVNTARKAAQGRVPGLSAEVAFYTVLSLPPLLLVMLGSVGFVTEALGPEAQADVREAIISGAETFLSPSTITELVEPAIDGLLAQGRVDLLTIGAIVALWSASRATRVVIEAVTIAYDRVPKWTWWQRRLVAVGLTVAGVVAVVLLLPLLVVGPEAGAGLADQFGLGQVFETVWSVAYWPVVVAVGILVLTWIYHLVEPDFPWRWEVPGAVLALAIWAVGSFALRYYATNFIEGESVYRLFAAPLVILLWAYVSAFAVLIGANLNAEVDRFYDEGLLPGADDPPRGGDPAGGAPAGGAPASADQRGSLVERRLDDDGISVPHEP